MHDLWVSNPASYPHKQPFLHPPLHPPGVEACTPSAHFHGVARPLEIGSDRASTHVSADHRAPLVCSGVRMSPQSQAKSDEHSQVCWGGTNRA